MSWADSVEQETERRIQDEWDGLDSFSLAQLIVQRERRLASINNSLFGSEGYFTNPDAVEQIEMLKSELRRYQRELRTLQSDFDDAIRQLRKAGM